MNALISHLLGHLRLLPLMLCAALAACGTTPSAPPPSELFNDASFRAPAAPVDARLALAPSPAMREYVRVDLSRAARSRNPRRALAMTLYDKAGLKLEYEASMTRTAAQAFDARSGNCLSLVLMTAALAREMGLEVQYQTVLGEESWSRDGDTYFVAGHVNLVLGRRLGQNADSYDADASLLIDFLPAEDLTGQRTRLISESTILAMYLNNRAAETMAGGDLDQAYWFARAAIVQEPSFAGAFNTLGIIQLRHGDLDAAQRTLAHALERSPANTVLLSNLAQALYRLGRGSEARLLRSRLRKCPSIGWSCGKRMSPVMRNPRGFVCTPWNWMPWSSSTTPTPSSIPKKSKCHQPRRNSPSVTTCRPFSRCLATTSRMASSSIWRSAAASISPAANCSRACKAWRRRRLFLL